MGVKEKKRKEKKRVEICCDWWEVGHVTQSRDVTNGGPATFRGRFDVSNGH